MIEYIKGSVDELTPTYVVIETQGGVSYLLNISLVTYGQLEGVAQTRMLVHESVREDAWNLYGFLNEGERTIFRQLIGVSGVGAGTAMLILSALPLAELEQVILSGDSRRLKSVKGIGAKTAERIIVDLRDKIKPSGDTLITQLPAESSEAFDESVAALVMLGFPRQQSVKVLRKLFDADPALKVETAVRKALAMM